MRIRLTSIVRLRGPGLVSVTNRCEPVEQEAGEHPARDAVDYEYFLANAARGVGQHFEGAAPFTPALNSCVYGALEMSSHSLPISRFAWTAIATSSCLVCVHGNRFIQWSTFKTLALQPNFTFVGIEKMISDEVERTVEKVVAAVKTRFADSYPASLFKNLSKCRALAS
jgi:hypothetical protein